MTYATGSVTTQDQIIDAIQAFAEANGWTTNMAAADGTHKRLHIQKNSIYANFSSNYTPASYLFGLNLSSGFNSAAAWNAQTAPVSTTFAPLLSTANSPWTYHLFCQHTPELLAGVFVGPSNTCVYFAIGEMAKAGAFTGGEFVTAGNTISGAIQTTGNPTSLVSNVKSGGAWINPYTWGTPAAIALPYNLSPLLPVRVFENVTTGGNTGYKFLGNLPGIRITARGYANGDEITYGSEVWKVFYDYGATNNTMVAFKK